MRLTVEHLFIFPAQFHELFVRALLDDLPMLDTVEDVLGEIYEEENIEDLLDGVFEKREDQKKLVGLPHLFQRIP